MGPFKTCEVTMGFAPILRAGLAPRLAALRQKGAAL
jgi:hypothetical protein